MDKIYIRKKDKVIVGPYAVSSLHRYRLRSTDKVWYEGLNEWQPAQKIDFLKEYISTNFFSRLLSTR
jgi:hypothetical protein